MFCSVILRVQVDIIQMMHDGECDMLKYICPSVEMSVSIERHIYLHVTRVHHASYVLSHH